VSSAIKVSNLKKTYPGRPPVEAVRGIDLDVQVGECFGVLGPNGAGKTSTIEILEGIQPLTSGEVSILGFTWEKDSLAIKERIGVSLQETQFSERLTVLETLRLFRSFFKTGMTPERAMQIVSLEEKANSWIKKLSGGQKQRLAVACSLVGDPQLLFLDEPTTGLDPGSRRQLWEIIDGFRKQGRTVLLTTHYMEEAERLCDRVAIVDLGKIIALGTPRELIASLGAEHVIELTMENGKEVDGYSDWMRELPFVENVAHEQQVFSLTVSEIHAALPELLNQLQQREIKLSTLTTREASLEDVFVQKTGRHLTDEQATS
jgi:ABC-2 type transport system ATP-binding protein